MNFNLVIKIKLPIIYFNYLILIYIKWLRYINNKIIRYFKVSQNIFILSKLFDFNKFNLGLYYLVINRFESLLDQT